MYKLSVSDRNNIRNSVLLIECGDSLSELKNERQVANMLPFVPDLADTLAASARMELLGNLAAKQRAAFIALYGNEFGCDVVNEVTQTEQRQVASNSTHFCEKHLILAIKEV